MKWSFWIVIFTLMISISGCLQQESKITQTTTVTTTVYEEEIYIEEYFKASNYILKEIEFNLTHPMMDENIRWGEIPITIHIDNKTCKYNKLNEIRDGMKIWKTESNNLISFKEVDEISEANVNVSCITQGQMEKTIVDDEWVIYNVGEAFPVWINTGLFNLIVGGEVKIGYTSSECGYPVRTIHEFGHILGFDHTNDSKSVMYEKEDCKQNFTNEMKQTISELYKIESLPDLYFSDVSAKKLGRYLDVFFTVENRGLVTSKPTTLMIKIDGKTIKNVDIEEIDPEFIYTSYELYNLEVPLKFDLIELIIDPDKKIREIDEENNVISLIK